MDPEISAVRAIPDLYDRAREAGRLARMHNNLGVLASRVRREALRLISKQGVSNTAIGRELGISGTQVGRLLSSGPAVEGMFLGDGPITVVMARKAAADPRGSGSLVAQEDHMAYDLLARLAASLQLEVVDEVVDAPCDINLNRRNLFVMCGPRMALNMPRILERDPNIQFQKDDRGWYLRDVPTGVVYRSPMDAGNHFDFAYFGRLIRPDKQGSFLYAAGIHAMGELGVIHLLLNTIADIHAERGMDPFSAIISCRFDPETLKVLDSQRVTPLYTSEK